MRVSTKGCKGSGAWLRFLLILACLLVSPLLRGCGSLDSQMLQALQSEDPQERLKGLNHFAKSQEPIAKSYLILLLEDKSPQVRQAAFTNLALRPDHNVTSYMRKALESGLLENDPYCVRRYVQAWGLLGTPDAVNAISSVIADADQVLLEISLQSLCLMSAQIEASLDSITPAMTPALFDMLCRMCSRTGNANLASRLSQMVGSPENRRSVERMAMIMGPPALRGYGPLFRKSHQGLRFWILDLLGKMGCGDVENIIFVSLNQKDQALAVRALEALAKVNRPNLARPLMPSVVKFLIGDDHLCAQRAVQVIGRGEMTQLTVHLMNAYYRFRGAVGLEVLKVLIDMDSQSSIDTLLISADAGERLAMACACVNRAGEAILRNPLRKSLENFIRREYQVSVMEPFTEQLIQKIPCSQAMNLLAPWYGRLSAEYRLKIDRASQASLPVSAAAAAPARPDPSGFKPSDQEKDLSMAQDYGLNYTASCSLENRIMDHLFDDRAELRRWAMRNALATLGDSAVLSLIPLLDRSDARGTDARNCIAACGKGAIPYLRLAVGCASAQRLRRIIEILSYIGDSSGFDIIKPLLTHSSPAVRALAVEAAAGFGAEGFKALEETVGREDIFASERKRIRLILENRTNRE